jgi:hypothetical protein
MTEICNLCAANHPAWVMLYDEFFRDESSAQGELRL